MKNLYLALFTLLIMSASSSVGNAQSIDLAVTKVHLSADQIAIPLGMRSSMAMTVENADSSIVEAGETIDFMISIDGTIYSSSLELASDLSPGDSLYHNFGSASLHQFPDTSMSHSVFGVVQYTLDSNISNDTLVANYVTTPFSNNDWQAVSLEVLSPTGLDSFDIDNGTNSPPNIDLVRVVLRNASFVQYLKWTPISYRLVLAQDTTLLTGSIEFDSVGNGDSTFRMLSNQAIMPDVPDSVGNYSFCVISDQPWDLNASNDTACYAFAIVDLYDPNDPVNWPWAIEERDANTLSIVAQANYIRFEGVDQALELRIFNVQGGLMATEFIDGPTTLSTNVLAPGVYMVQAIANDGHTWGTKFVKY
ncbi:MAG: T9SS type A sorting domain-containing protein [Flavobacteriales bacterium]|nr:T9SS type A sorting domain-containing protein [Flavobacteriales bacterium]